MDSTFLEASLVLNQKDLILFLYSLKSLLIAQSQLKKPYGRQFMAGIN